MRVPTDEELFDACLSRRHDFGLLNNQEQMKLLWEANEWFRAWQKTLEHGPSNISKSLIKSREEQAKTSFAPPSVGSLIWNSLKEDKS